MKTLRQVFFACAVLAEFAAALCVAGESKKGLQVQMVDDAIALGVRHAAINVNLVDLGAKSEGPNEFVMLDDQKFEFNSHYVRGLDATINPLLDNGVTIYLIILAYDTGNAELKKNYIHPTYNPACPFHISAFNTGDLPGRQRFRAEVTFLTRRYSRAGGPPIHFIVGNEVNSHWFWYNMGEVPMEAVADQYERTVRACQTAAASVSPRSKVYLSLDHHWNASMTPKEPKKSFGGRRFIEAFAKLAKERGDFDWNLAYHPYPENLFDARFWNDKAATMELSTPKITFKNIELLNEIMKQPELLYRGCPRRIILSEQGFHSTTKPDGELIQAAAYAYAYKKIEKLDGIDAFILHRHVDHSAEGGLHLGLWTGDKSNRPVKKKMIYDVFKAAGTAEWEGAFKFALPVVGLKTWEDGGKE